MTAPDPRPKEITSPRLEAALECARRGGRVLALHSIRDGLCTCGNLDCAHPGKHPRWHRELLPHGLNSVTADEGHIRAMWRTWPDANIGRATGGGRMVLDVDPRHGGDESLAELERQHDKLPDSVEVATGGGGRHIEFSYVGHLASRTIAPGLEVKAEGGYV